MIRLQERLDRRMQFLWREFAIDDAKYARLNDAQIRMLLRVWEDD